MELSDLLDSDTLECCEHMTDENTSEGDQSLDYCLLHTTAYRSPWKQHSATNTGARLRTYTRRSHHSTPCACANAPNQPENKVYYGASQVLYGKSITSSGPIRLCDSNELCTNTSLQVNFRKLYIRALGGPRGGVYVPRIPAPLSFFRSYFEFYFKNG